jgi:peroxiredoxin
MVATNSVMLPLGTPAPGFTLTDTVSGRPVSSAEFAGKPLLVLFICNHCPYVQFIRSKLAEVTRDYLARGVAVVGISSNDAEAYPADGPEAMAREAVSIGYQFPYLFDADQRVATAYHAACTPDLMLFDHAHRLFYRGQFCTARRKVTPVQIPTGADLTAAVEAVLAKAAPPSPQRSSIGCNIKWKPGHEPEYFQSTIIR